MNSIILTGANRGLGREIHDILVNSNSLSADFTFISRRPIEEPYQQCKYIQLDFMDTERQSFKLSVAPETKTVIFISNAGTIDPIGKSASIPLAEMEKALRINCTGPLALAQWLSLKTKELCARLHIINISSGAARRPIKGWMAYCASKSAAVMALDVLALENSHVTVQHFDPGVMDTDMQRHIRGQPKELMPDVGLFQEFKNNHTLKSPREVAETIVMSVRERL